MAHIFLLNTYTFLVLEVKILNRMRSEIGTARDVMGKVTATIEQFLL